MATSTVPLPAKSPSNPSNASLTKRRDGRRGPRERGMGFMVSLIAPCGSVLDVDPTEDDVPAMESTLASARLGHAPTVLGARDRMGGSTVVR